MNERTSSEYGEGEPGEPGPANHEALVQRLMSDTGRTRADCEVRARELAAIDPSLAPALRRWAAHGAVDEDLMVHGYSLRRLLAEGKCRTVSGAFALLGALARDPERTLAILAMADEWRDECGWAGDQ
jgi:hypothetical protein